MNIRKSFIAYQQMCRVGDMASPAWWFFSDLWHKYRTPTVYPQTYA